MRKLSLPRSVLMTMAVVVSFLFAPASANAQSTATDDVAQALRLVVGANACDEQAVRALTGSRTVYLQAAQAAVDMAAATTGRGAEPRALREAGELILEEPQLEQSLLQYRGFLLVTLAASPGCTDTLSADVVSDLAAEAYRVVTTEGGLSVDFGEYTRAVFALQSRYLNGTPGFPESEYARLVTAYDQAGGLAAPDKMRVLYRALEMLLVQKIDPAIDTEHERLRVLEFVQSVLEALAERDPSEDGVETSIEAWTLLETDLEQLGHNLGTITAFRRGFHMTHVEGWSDPDRAIGLLDQMNDLLIAYRTERGLGPVKMLDSGEACRKGIERIVSAIGTISMATVENRQLETLAKVEETWHATRDESLGWFDEVDQRVLAPYYRYGAKRAQDLYFLPKGMRRPESFTETVEFIEHLREIGLTSQGAPINDVYFLIDPDTAWPTMSEVGLEGIWLIGERFASNLGTVPGPVYARWATAEASFLSADQSYLGNSLGAYLVSEAGGNVAGSLRQAGHDGLSNWFVGTLGSNPGATRQDWPIETPSSLARLHNYSVSCIRHRIGEFFGETLENANGGDCALAEESDPRLAEHLRFIAAWQPNTDRQVGVWGAEHTAMGRLRSVDIAAEVRAIQLARAAAADELRKQCRDTTDLSRRECRELNPEDPDLVIVTSTELISHLAIPEMVEVANDYLVVR